MSVADAVAQHAVQAMELLGVVPRAVVVRGLERVEQLAAADRVRVRDEGAGVAVLADRRRDDAARQAVEEADACRAGRCEVALLGVVRSLAIADAIDELRDQPVQVRVALAVRMRRHVDRHAVDPGREVGAVVEVEAAQVVLVGFPVAAVLRHDDAGDELQHLRGPKRRPALDQLRRDRAGARGVGAADRVDVVAVDLHRRQCLRLRLLRRGVSGGGERGAGEREKACPRAARVCVAIHRKSRP